MKMANTSAKLLACLALALPLAMAASAQNQAARERLATKAKAAKTGKSAVHAKAAAAAKPPAKANPEASTAAIAPQLLREKTRRRPMVGKRDPFAPLINDKKDRPCICHRARRDW